MSANVQFGMLQRIKSQKTQNNPKLQNIQAQITAQMDIYTQAKIDLEKQQNGEQGVQAQTFATPPMSVDELESKMNEAQDKLEQLQAAFTVESDQKDASKIQGKPNEDEKNKIQPKQFGSFMA